MHQLTFVTVLLQKPTLFAPKLNSILLLQFIVTLNIYPSPVYQVLNFNWSALLKGILPTHQSHGWNNGTHGGHQLGSGDLHLLPLAMWLTGVSLATVWASWLYMGVPRGGFCHPPTPTQPTHQTTLSCLTPPHPTAHPHPLYYQC